MKFIDFLKEYKNENSFLFWWLMAIIMLIILS